MSLPLDLAYCRDYRRGTHISQLNVMDCRDDLIYIKDYRTFEYYKRIGGRFVFARKLSRREKNDFYFNNGKSFRGCTIVERV